MRRHGQPGRFPTRQPDPTVKNLVLAVVILAVLLPLAGCKDGQSGAVTPDEQARHRKLKEERG